MPHSPSILHFCCPCLCSPERLSRRDRWRNWVCYNKGRIESWKSWREVAQIIRFHLASIRAVLPFGRSSVVCNDKCILGTTAIFSDCGQHPHSTYSGASLGDCCHNFTSCKERLK
jgi:hypothetical protein